MKFQVEVEPPNLDVRVSTPTPIYTAIFRWGNLMSRVIPAGIGRAQDPLRPQVAITPSSVGASADTFLVEYKESGGEGRVNLVGADIVDSVLDSAESGQSATPAKRRNITPDKMKNLEKYGFKVYGPYGLTGSELPAEELARQYAYYKIDSTQVREGHDVKFVRHNLVTDGPLPDLKADMLFSHNFLNHLKPGEATQAVENMVASMGDRGVISFGDYFQYDEKMEMGAGRVFLRDWLAFTAKWLRQKEEFRPLITSSVGTPVVFARD